MKIDVMRFSANQESTLGLLFVDKKFECYTLEDEARTKKVFGETRIPAGEYEISLRQEGGFHARYLKRFPNFHRGMLHVLNIPGFEYVLIHIGNTDDDTAGCLLVGDQANNNQIRDGEILNSSAAYSRLYKKVVLAMDKKEPITIQYHDNMVLN